MKIRYAGPCREVILRDVLTTELRTWQNGEVKDVPDDLNAVVIETNPQEREPGAPPSTMNAVKAILNGGPHFVDDATGKNPLFTCADCGEPADSEHFRPAETTIRYRSDDDEPLCVPCFLVAHPEHEAYHVGRGLPRRFAAAIAAKRAAIAAPAAASAPTPRSYAAPAAATAVADHDEEN